MATNLRLITFGRFILCIGCLVATFLPRGPAFAQEPAESAPEVSQALPERVASVGDKIISGEGFKHSVEYLWRSLEIQRGTHVEPDMEFRFSALNQLIDGLIVDILAETSGLEVSEEEVLKDFEQGKAAMSSPEAYDAYLKERGYTDEYVLEEIRARLQKERYLISLRQGVTVTEKALREAYEELKASGRAYRARKTADVGHIMVRTVAAEIAGADAARARMEAAHKRIVSGEPFPDVAREVSEDAASAEQGGLYPDSMSGTVPPIIEELMFTLPLGEVSEPIQSEMGWHLMIVYKRYNPGMYTFEELREQFREPLIDKQVQAIIAEKVATLRKILRIEIDEAAVAAIPLHEEH